MSLAAEAEAHRLEEKEAIGKLPRPNGPVRQSLTVQFHYSEKRAVFQDSESNTTYQVELKCPKRSGGLGAIAELKS
jgi:hypothetical protein